MITHFSRKITKSHQTPTVKLTRSEFNTNLGVHRLHFVSSGNGESQEVQITQTDHNSKAVQMTGFGMRGVSQQIKTKQFPWLLLTQEGLSNTSDKTTAVCLTGLFGDKRSFHTQQIITLDISQTTTKTF